MKGKKQFPQSNTLSTKEVLRKKLLKFTMYENNLDAKQEAQHLYDYLGNVDTRNKKVRQNIMNRIDVLNQTEDCKYCDPMIKSEPLEDTWQKNSNISSEKKPLKLTLKMRLKRFIDTEPSIAKEHGKRLFDDIDNIDIRKKEDQERFVNDLDFLINMDDCNTCDKLKPLKDETRQRFRIKK